MNSLTGLSQKFLDTYNRNIKFFESVEPSLVNSLNNLTSNLPENSPFLFSLDDKKISDIQDSCISTYRQNIIKPKNISLGKVFNQATGLKDINDLFQEIIDSHGTPILASLPVLREGNNSVKDVVPADQFFVGSLPLYSLAINLKGCNLELISSVTIAEDSLEHLAITFLIVDLPDLFSSLKENNISVALLYSPEPKSLIESTFHYISNKIPFALLGMHVFGSCLQTAGYAELTNWLFSHSGIGHRFIGKLGSTTDELNQFLQVSENIRKSQGSFAVIKQSEQPKDALAVVVASGPSLDQNIHNLKKLQHNSTIFCSASSIGTLLMNNIVPDFLVMLERGMCDYVAYRDFMNKGYDISSIPCVRSITTHPYLDELFENSIFFGRPSSGSAGLVSREDDFYLPHAGPESSNAALEVALRFGFQNVALFGCDFATTDRAYTRSREAIGATPREMDEPVPGSDGKTVYSQPSLLLARDVFVNSLKIYRPDNIYRYGPGAKFDYPSSTDINLVLYKKVQSDYLLSLCTKELSVNSELYNSHLSELNNMLNQVSSFFQYNSFSYEDIKTSLKEASVLFDDSNASPSSNELINQLGKIIRQSIIFTVNPLRDSCLLKDSVSKIDAVQSFQDSLRIILNISSTVIQKSYL